MTRKPPLTLMRLGVSRTQPPRRLINSPLHTSNSNSLNSFVLFTQNRNRPDQTPPPYPSDPHCVTESPPPPSGGGRWWVPLYAWWSLARVSEITLTCGMESTFFLLLHQPPLHHSPTPNPNCDAAGLLTPRRTVVHLFPSLSTPLSSLY